MCVKVKQINNLTINKDADGMYIVKAPTGAVLYSTMILQEAVLRCQACKAYLTPSTNRPAVVLRGGDELPTETILCNSVADAKRVIKTDVTENQQNGDTLIKRMSAVPTCVQTASIVGPLTCATMSHGGMVQWWKIFSDDALHSSAEYK